MTALSTRANGTSCIQKCPRATATEGHPGGSAFGGFGWLAKGLWKSGFSIRLGGPAPCGSCALSGNAKQIEVIAARYDFLIDLEPIMTDKTHIGRRGKLL
jgi:hypothetical protein